MKRLNLIILGSVVFIILFSVVGYILYDNFKFSTYEEKDGIKYKIEEHYARIIDGTNATKSNYTFKEIKKKPIIAIDNYAFKGNQNIRKIIAPNLEEIGISAFEDSFIEELDITREDKSKETFIAIHAFKNCKFLQNVKLTKTKLYPEAFMNCGDFSLTLTEDSYVERSQTLTLAPISPFRGVKLKEISLLKTDKKLLNYENGVLYSYRHYFWNSPDHLDMIEKKKAKAVLYLDTSVTELSFEDDEIIYLFAGIGDKLEEINVNNTNPYYSSLDGVLYSKDYSCLYRFPSKSKSNQLHENVNGIAQAAFSGSYYDKTLVLSKNTKLASYAFVGAENLNIDFNYSALEFNTIYESTITFSNALINSDTYNQFQKN